MFTIYGDIPCVSFRFSISKILKMMSPLENSSSASVVKKPAVVADSWSHTAHEPEVKHKHAWSVESFSEKMKIENKKLITSKEFTISIKDISTRWSLALSPNGCTEDSEGNISIFLLCLGNPPFPIRSKFVISIVDKDGSFARTEKFEKVFAQKENQNPYLGQRKYESHSRLQDAELKLLPDDTLTIICDMYISKENDSVVTGGTSRPHPVPSTRMKEVQQAGATKCLEDLGNIFNDSSFSDFTVACQGREFMCHQAILAGRSTYFHKMLSHDMEEKEQKCVDIQDFTADIVKEMLLYIYTGKAGDLEENAAGLLAAAEKYDLQELKRMCEESLCSTMTTDNVLDMLVLADHNNADLVRTAALKLIVENGDQIVAVNGWSNKMKKYPELMSEMFEAMTEYPAKKRLCLQ